MKFMGPTTASALNWFALIVNVLGLIALDVVSQFTFSSIATLMAVIVVVFARKGQQIFGAVVVLVSLAFAVTGYPRYEEGMAKYRERAKASSLKVPAPPAAKQEERK